MGASSLLLFSLSVACLANLEEKNPYVPAAPGETPKCAKKGTSYCEYVDDYPEYVINSLSTPYS